MEKVSRQKPPRWASRFLEWYCKPSLYEDLQGDLLECFERNVEKKGADKAKLIYIIDVIKFFRSYTVQKPQIFGRMDHMLLIGNYFKTAVRSMARSKLFTAINVVGLAISMVAGLLLISLLYDLHQVDAFHEKKDNIYRIISSRLDADGEINNFASTSPLAATRIAAEVPGVEEMVVLSSDFGGDVTAGEKSLPLQGYWASAAFFDVFSFQLLKGNRSTALVAPNTVVLSESAAIKLFGHTDVLGKTLELANQGAYKRIAGDFRLEITGIMADFPSASHLRADILASYITYKEMEDRQLEKSNANPWLASTSSFVYVLLDESNNRDALAGNLKRISLEENARTDVRIDLQAQALTGIVPGPYLQNWAGPSIDEKKVWILAILACVILVSACFNYTNLSIARALRRSKEVAIRKVIGAGKPHIVAQFLMEAVLIAFASLFLSLLMFAPVRNEFLSMDEYANDLISLDLNFSLIAFFAGFTIAIGLVAGVIPAFFFSRIKGAKGTATRVPGKSLFYRRVLIVLQYGFTLAFITAASMAYRQFHHSVNFDLGYSTHNVVNIELQGNKPELLMEKLAGLPEIEGVARSSNVTSTGSYWFTRAKYSPSDSASMCFAAIDENYLPLLDHEIIAGENFHHTSGNSGTGVIVNEQFVKRFGIASPSEAIGERIDFYGKKEPVIGVVSDFHYGTLESPVGPFVFRYMPKFYDVLNVKLKQGQLADGMKRIEEAWTEIDAVHPLAAAFFDERLEKVYAEYLTMVKVVGFLAFLSISIASLGLLGMIVFTTETRLKEISIRKVLGATERSLVYLLGKGFMLLLVISAVLAIPATFYLFTEVVLSDVIFKASFGFFELCGGLLLVLFIALLAIGTQTLKAARTNPAQILRNE